MSATARSPRRSFARIVEPAASHGMTLWELVEGQRPSHATKTTAAHKRGGVRAYAGEFFGYHRDSHGVIVGGVDRFPLRYRQ